MKMRLRNLFFLIGMGYFCSAHSAQKPSAWQKFKNVFTSKKPDAMNEAEDAKKGLSFFQSIKKLYENLRNFYAYSQEYMLVLGLKVKGLKAMQEEAKKNTQKEQLEMPLKRLRADFFMSLVEYLKQTKGMVQGIKIFMQERGSSSVSTFDSILQTFDSIIKEGDHLTGQLLQASQAYGLKSDEKKVETKINSYFAKIVKLLSTLKKAVDESQKIINKTMPLLKGINVLSLGSATALVLLVGKLNNVLKTFQLATDVGRDITSLVDNEMARKVSALQNESIEMTKDFEASKINIQKIENALENNKSEFEKSIQPMSNFNAQAQAGKSFESDEDQSDELVFEDLKYKNK